MKVCQLSKFRERERERGWGVGEGDRKKISVGGGGGGVRGEEVKLSSQLISHLFFLLL